MKKIILLLLLTLFLAGGSIAMYGQYVVTNECSTVTVENGDGDKILDISPYENAEDRVKIKIAGIEVIVSNNNTATVTTTPKTKRKLTLPGHIAFLEVGVNMLPNPDYSLYPAVDGGFLELNNIRSLQWSFCLADAAFRLTPDGLLALSTGIQMLWNNYMFDNRITLVKEDGRVVPSPITDNWRRRSKLVTFGLQIPLIMEINMPKNLFVACGVYGGVNLSSRAVVKNPRQRMNSPYMNVFYYGVTARFGIDDFYVYANYGLAGFFKTGRGPEVYPLTIGIGLGF